MTGSEQAPAESRIIAPPGLKNVVVADTALGGVRGGEGFYHYRQYSAIDLALGRSFEDVWQLMIDGALPDASASDAFRTSVRGARRLPPVVAENIHAIAALAAPDDPLGALRTALSGVGSALGLRPVFDTTEEVRRDEALAAAAVIPTLVAALHRAARGQAPVLPRDDLGHAANYLYMLDGVEPSSEHAAAIEKYLIAMIDHGFNASTFTARVIASTGADLAACLVGALAALSGPLHGGAPSRAVEMIETIGSPGNADAWLRERIRAGDRIMGFGHAVYSTEDPRSRMLKNVALSLGGPLVELATGVEERAEALLAELKPGRNLHTNVEFYSGVVMELCGLPRELFTPTFAVGRVVGWSAHVLEQARDSKIIRPASRYTGPTPPAPLPSE